MSRLIDGARFQWRRRARIRAIDARLRDDPKESPILHSLARRLWHNSWWNMGIQDGRRVNHV